MLFFVVVGNPSLKDISLRVYLSMLDLVGLRSVMHMPRSKQYVIVKIIVS
jgi:hypothetical protein